MIFAGSLEKSHANEPTDLHASTSKTRRRYKMCLKEISGADQKHKKDKLGKRKKCDEPTCTKHLVKTVTTNITR